MSRFSQCRTPCKLRWNRFCSARNDFPKKHWLLQPGQVSDRLYFIEQGLARGYYLKEGREATSWFMHEGDFIISIVSFFTRKPAREFIELLEDSTIWSINFEQLQHSTNVGIP